MRRLGILWLVAIVVSWMAVPVYGADGCFALFDTSVPRAIETKRLGEGHWEVLKYLRGEGLTDADLDVFREHAVEFDRANAGPRNLTTLWKRLETLTSENPRNAKLSRDEAYALILYVEHAYEELNWRIRARDSEVFEEGGFWRSYAKVLASALKHCAKFEGTTYRAADIKGSDLTRYQPGRVVSEPFLSTNKVRFSGWFSTKVKFVIAFKNGADISPFNRVENEVYCLQGFSESCRSSLVGIRPRLFTWNSSDRRPPCFVTSNKPR